MSTRDRKFREWLRKLRRGLEIIKAALARNEWALEILTAELDELEKWQEDELMKQAEMDRTNNHNRKPNRTAARKRATASRSRAARSSNSIYVTKGVKNVVIEHDRDGLMLVRVEKIGLAAPLKNRQRLRQLLLALSGKVSHVNMSEDAIVPFKTKSELIEAIEELSGQRISESNLQNLVQQLRSLFVKAKINPKLIETGGGGYRLRICIDGRILENVVS